jgi:hypothetical protein
MWRRAAHNSGAPVAVIAVTCSDPDVHRRRLSSRVREIEGFPEPTWQEVGARRNEWEEWAEDHLVLDTVEPLNDNVDRALAYIRR